MHILTECSTNESLDMSVGFHLRVWDLCNIWSQQSLTSEDSYNAPVHFRHRQMDRQTYRQTLAS